MSAVIDIPEPGRVYKLTNFYNGLTPPSNGLTPPSNGLTKKNQEDERETEYDTNSTSENSSPPRSPDFTPEKSPSPGTSPNQTTNGFSPLLKNGKSPSSDKLFQSDDSLDFSTLGIKPGDVTINGMEASSHLRREGVHRSFQLRNKQTPDMQNALDYFKHNKKEYYEFITHCMLKTLFGFKKKSPEAHASKPRRNQFCLLLPKVELHEHLEGTVYYEQLIKKAHEQGLHLTKPEKKGNFSLVYEPSSLTSSEGTYIDDEEKEDASVILKDAEFDYVKGLYSDVNGGKFHNLFGFIGAVTGRLKHSELVIPLLREAIRLKMLYKEEMMELSNIEIPKEFFKIFPSTKDQLTNNDLEKWFAFLSLPNGFLENSLEKSVDLLNELEEDLISEFGYNPLARNSDKVHLDQVEVRFGINLEVMRNKSLRKFFARAAAAMYTAEKDARVFGMTADGPQDSHLACEDFEKQLQIIAFLRDKFKKPRITMHALEVNRKNTTPERAVTELGQILNAINPDRLGHLTGISDISTPKDLDEQLAFMKRRKIAVELCLTSVQLTIDAGAQDVPFSLLLKNGVPIVFGSDDPGLTRSTLSREIKKAIKRYNIPYQTLKTIIQNGIEYSFLPGDSIYDAPEDGRTIYQRKEKYQTISKNDPILQSDKAVMQLRLERLFTEFEAYIVKDFIPHLEIEDLLPKNFTAHIEDKLRQFSFQTSTVDPLTLSV